MPALIALSDLLAAAPIDVALFLTTIYLNIETGNGRVAPGGAIIRYTHQPVASLKSQLREGGECMDKVQASIEHQVDRGSEFDAMAMSPHNGDFVIICRDFHTTPMDGRHHITADVYMQREQIGTTNIYEDGSAAMFPTGADRLKRETQSDGYSVAHLVIVGQLRGEDVGV
ncbi:hypothetical protein GY45DRAFT_1341081 [Cubamyces sp. BRFM 1775]|nr:hypothetical protein GY45DRAFT_1341081 [Cubamyces sp. BRFM 1775]